MIAAYTALDLGVGTDSLNQGTQISLYLYIVTEEAQYQACLLITTSPSALPRKLSSA